MNGCVSIIICSCDLAFITPLWLRRVFAFTSHWIGILTQSWRTYCYLDLWLILSLFKPFSSLLEVGMFRNYFYALALKDDKFTLTSGWFSFQTFQHVSERAAQCAVIVQGAGSSPLLHVSRQRLGTSFFSYQNTDTIRTQTILTCGYLYIYFFQIHVTVVWQVHQNMGQLSTFRIFLLRLRIQNVVARRRNVSSLHWILLHANYWDAKAHNDFLIVEILI